MQYLISFLEGIITFISPCLLPMLPLCVSYFAGDGAEGKDNKKIVLNALGFILGFSTLFVLMGAFAGLFGALLTEYRTAVQIVTGAVVIFFGLHFLGLFRFTLFRGSRPMEKRSLGFFSALLFGVVFAVGWTPCVGAFLGSALMMAAGGGDVTEGILMLLAYSAGLGIPFFVSAILIDKLKGAFTVIKKHYGLINRLCGIFLVLIGVLMATGLFGKFLALLS